MFSWQHLGKKLGFPSSLTVSASDALPDGQFSGAVNFSGVASFAGAAIARTLASIQSIISSCIIDLDATIADSYSGSGTTWANICPAPADSEPQTAYDFQLGDGADSGTYPILVGAAGQFDSYWTTDGARYFTLAGSITEFLRTLTRIDGAQQEVTILVAEQSPDLGADANYLFNAQNSSDGNSQFGVVARKETGKQVSQSILRLGTTSNSPIATPANDATDTPVLHAARFRKASDFVVKANLLDGEGEDTVLNGTFSSNTSRVNIWRHIASFGTEVLAPSGARLFSVIVFNSYLSSTQLEQAAAFLSARHGRPYSLTLAPDPLAGEVSFTAAGTLSGNATVNLAGAVGFSAAGTLTGAATVNLAGAVTFSATGTLAGAGTASSGSAFPQIESFIADRYNTTTPAITMPSGVQAGDLLLAFVAFEGSSVTAVDTGVSGGNWTWSYEGWGPSVGFAWKIAEGSDALQFTNAGGADEWASVVYRISGAQSVSGENHASGVSTANTDWNPESHTPPNGEDSYLWFVSCCVNQNGPASAPPANYTDMKTAQGWDSGTSHLNYLMTAQRALTATVDDPAAFTAGGSARWRCNTVAVKPSA